MKPTTDTPIHNGTYLVWKEGEYVGSHDPFLMKVACTGVAILAKEVGGTELFDVEDVGVGWMWAGPVEELLTKQEATELYEKGRIEVADAAEVEVSSTGTAVTLAAPYLIIAKLDDPVRVDVLNLEQMAHTAVVTQLDETDEVCGWLLCYTIKKEGERAIEIKDKEVAVEVANKLIEYGKTP